jgi:hypothetical protein
MQPRGHLLFALLLASCEPPAPIAAAPAPLARDPIATPPIEATEILRSHRVAARSAFDRAHDAAGGPARVVVFEPESLRGPITKGMLRPDGAPAGVLRRAASLGDGFPARITGPEIAAGPTLVAIFGPHRPLVIASRDGSEARSIPLYGVTEAMFLPGEKELVALAGGEIHRVDVASKSVAGHAVAAGKGLRLAGATRLVAGTQILRYPELTPVFTVPEGVEVSPRVVAYTEAREVTKKGKDPQWRTWLVVRRVGDGATVLERDLGDDNIDPEIGIHPSGRFVAWLGEVYAARINTGEILDVETGKIRQFPYRGIARVQIAAMRITADGKAACTFDLGWTPSQLDPWRDTHCWIHDGEAVIVSVPFTPHFRPIAVPGSQGSLSPDGKLAVFVELGDRLNDRSRLAVRVIDVATGQNVKRFELGTTDRYDGDAVMVTNSAVHVVSGEPFDGYYDARTGARMAAPPDAREPDLGVLPPSDETSLKHDEPHVLVRGELLELKNNAGSSCWSAADLRPAPADGCKAPKPADVVIKARVATIPGAAPVHLAIPVTGTRGVVIKLGKADALLVPDENMARYFSMKGDLLGTIVALSPTRFAGILPDGRFDLIGEGDEGRDRLACLAGDRIFSFETCADLRLAPHALLGALGAR